MNVRVYELLKSFNSSVDLLCIAQDVRRTFARAAMFSMRIEASRETLREGRAALSSACIAKFQEEFSREKIRSDLLLDISVRDRKM